MGMVEKLELAQCMVSELGAKESYMKPIKELGLELVPALHGGESQTQLYDVYLPLTALNCPHPSVRNRPDGHVTGDLFEQVRPGYYAFRKWIHLSPPFLFLLLFFSGLMGRV